MNLFNLAIVGRNWGMSTLNSGNLHGITEDKDEEGVNVRHTVKQSWSTVV